MKILLTVFFLFFSLVNYIQGQKILFETNGLEDVLIENLNLNEKQAQSKLSPLEFTRYKSKIVREVIDSLQRRSKDELLRDIEFLSFLTETDYRVEHIDNPLYSINLIASPTFIEQAIATGCTQVQARILSTIELKWKEVLQEVEYLKKFELKKLQHIQTKKLQNRIRRIVKLVGNIEAISGMSAKTNIDYSSHQEVKVYLRKVRESAQELRNLQNGIREYLEITKEELREEEKNLKSAMIGLN